MYIYNEIVVLMLFVIVNLFIFEGVVVQLYVRFGSWKTERCLCGMLLSSPIHNILI